MRRSGKLTTMGDGYVTAMLDVLLGTRRVGSIALLPGDLSLFIFDDGYAADPSRPILSRYYRTASGTLRQETRPTRTKLPSWFSNLLPEGPLRTYLALRGGINPDRPTNIKSLALLA